VPEAEARALHLHTLSSLVADLVSGRSVETADGRQFALPDNRTRSALEWYRNKGAAAWTANQRPACRRLSRCHFAGATQLAGTPSAASKCQYPALAAEKTSRSHRFAGLHKFGTPSGAPPDYVHEFNSSRTLFEGRNGSGKTSLLNAIIWALTGEMLRAQRAPETAEDFDCTVTAPEGGEDSIHKLSSLTPMPNTELYRPDQPWVPADTWVELTFTDETGHALPIIRRSQFRSPQGKLREAAPDLSVLGIDPIAIRIGTIMPGLLPLIKVGSESELGRAVSQLTGLSALVDLAEHVRRAKRSIESLPKRRSPSEAERTVITERQRMT